jgi:hypothetical protein
MRRYVIEREIPGAGNLCQEELVKIAQTSNEAVASLGVPYTWINSFVAGSSSRPRRRTTTSPRCSPSSVWPTGVRSCCAPTSSA